MSQKRSKQNKAKKVQDLPARSQAKSVKGGAPARRGEQIEVQSWSWGAAP